MVWLEDENRHMGATFKLSELDISKLRAAYGCPDYKGTSCYLHLEESAGTISSSDPEKQKCQIFISAPHGSVKIATTKFQVRPLSSKRKCLCVNFFFAFSSLAVANLPVWQACIPPSVKCFALEMSPAGTNLLTGHFWI